MSHSSMMVSSADCMQQYHYSLREGDEARARDASLQTSMPILVCIPWLMIASLILRRLSSLCVPMARQRPLHWQSKGFAYRCAVDCCTFMYSFLFCSVFFLPIRLCALIVHSSLSSGGSIDEENAFSWSKSYSVDPRSSWPYRNHSHSSLCHRCARGVLVLVMHHGCEWIHWRRLGCCSMDSAT